MRRVWQPLALSSRWMRAASAVLLRLDPDAARPPADLAACHLDRQPRLTPLAQVQRRAPLRNPCGFRPIPRLSPHLSPSELSSLACQVGQELDDAFRAG